LFIVALIRSLLSHLLGEGTTREELEGFDEDGKKESG